MPFQPNHKLSRGRPKGSLNKASIDSQQLAAEMGVDPLQIILWFAQGNYEALKMQVHDITPEMRLKAAAEGCQYTRPKLKSIETKMSEEQINVLKMIVEDYSNRKNG